MTDEEIARLNPPTLVPTSGKLEAHISYACDLECVACTRASFLRKPHTPNLTLEDLRDAFRQADEIGWKPRIILIGGEPTLHPEIEQFVVESMAWSGTYVQVYSNGTQAKTREKLEYLRLTHSASICTDGWKTESVVDPTAYHDGKEWDMSTFVSPVDAGVEPRSYCWMSSAQICGVCLDHEGFSPCPPGGTIAALLAPRGRTKVLADLFDPEKVAAMYSELCRHCGNEFPDRIKRNVDRDVDAEKFRAYVEAQPKDLFGTPMSPTWRKAFEGKK